MQSLPTQRLHYDLIQIFDVSSSDKNDRPFTEYLSRVVVLVEASDQPAAVFGLLTRAVQT